MNPFPFISQPKDHIIATALADLHSRFSAAVITPYSLSSLTDIDSICTIHIKVPSFYLTVLLSTPTSSPATPTSPAKTTHPQGRPRGPRDPPLPQTDHRRHKRQRSRRRHNNDTPNVDPNRVQRSQDRICVRATGSDHGSMQFFFPAQIDRVSPRTGLTETAVTIYTLTPSWTD